MLGAPNKALPGTVRYVAIWVPIRINRVNCQKINKIFLGESAETEYVDRHCSLLQNRGCMFSQIGEAIWIRGAAIGCLVPRTSFE